MALLKAWRRRRAREPAAFPEIDSLDKALATLRGLRDDREFDEPLADLAVSAWTMRRVLTRDRRGRGLSPTEIELLRRRAEAVLKALAALDVILPDLDGRRYVEGMPIEVVEWRDDASVAAETIVETAAPLVLRAGRRLREPRVVIGAPQRKEGGS